MDPERWKQVDKLLQQAMERPAEEREAFLQRACGDDSALRDEVWSLLVSQQEAGSFLESPATDAVAEVLAQEKETPDLAAPAIAPGTMIAHYRVIEKIGEGGMGEVYQARDTKLQRDVALKILPQAMAHDAQRMARFEREARTLGSLNHPYIAAIHGLEESDGTRALVMELVEGETLAERLDRTQPSKHEPSPQRRSWAGGTGPGQESRGSALAIEDALPVARQIAEALEYAHERGVIHRDLKPANVKITPEGTVKVLDFGLAKVLSPQDSYAGLDPAHSPTLTSLATQPGMLLGTAAYMSPEQAKGQRVDRRADIWAFGCVLYEVLSGQKAFAGETISDVLAAVIKSEPEWDALPGTTPLSIQKLIRRCLQKDQRQRLRDIGEARVTIEAAISGSGEGFDIPTGSVAQREPKELLYRALPWAMVGTLVCLAAFAGWWFRTWNVAPARQHVIRFSVAPPENATLLGDAGMSLSPDGQKLAFISSPSPSQPQKLWVRPLDSLTEKPLQGTEDAHFPFWSPDGNYLGFYANGKLEKVAISGGPPQTLCEAHGNSATWGKSGVIVFTNRDQLFRVPESGGTPKLIASPPDAAHHESGYDLPQFLPDGRHFLFQFYRVSSMGTEEYSVSIGSLDSKEVVHLTTKSSNALYAPPGYLLYMNQTTLMARPFDAAGLKFTGQSVPIAEGVALDGGYGHFVVSQTGVLAYGTGASTNQNQMVWLNRKGEKLGTVGQPGVYSGPALSPDGTKLAVGRGKGGKRDIWIYNLKRGTASRLTFNPSDDLSPVWSEDESRILFTSYRLGQRDLYQKSASGLGNTQLVFKSKEQAKSLMDVSQDGRYAIYGTTISPSQLWVLPLFGERKPFPFVQGKFVADEGRFSPNGRYVCYMSNETGRDDVYVQTFPQHTGKWQISAGGGVEPIWRGDGRELFYLSPGDRVMAVEVNTAAGQFQAGTPKLLFKAQMIPPSYWRNIYVVSPDGQRFLMLEPASGGKPSPINVVVNWPALLKSQ